MQREIELKFFVNELGAVRKELKKIKAKFECRVSENDFFFDTSKETLKNKNAILRLRVGNTLSFLTYKDKVKSGKFKSADEYEVIVKNPLELKSILEKLGFVVWFSYLKPKREYWLWKGSHITLDSFPFGKFVEIEGSPSRIKLLAKKLNLDFSRSSSKSYIKLVKEYGRFKYLKI